MSDTRTPDGALLPIEERRKIYRRRWYEQNKEAVLKRQKAYVQEIYKTNPDKLRQTQRAWYARNRESQRIRAEIKNRRVYGLPEPTRPRPETCECCGRENKRRVLALDHCHLTGRFRGWLCDACNLGMGKLGDTAEALQKALEYLKRSSD
jgi:hypothetical protein